MNVNMPSTGGSDTTLEPGVLYLAKYTYGGAETVILDKTTDKVITIQEDGYIQVVREDFFERHYTIIRKYAPGESLTLSN